MTRYAMGLDLGGGGGRCLLLDLEQGVMHEASRPWRFQADPATGGIGFELDLDLIWAQLIAASQEVMDRADAAPSDIACIATTALRMGTVVIDRDGQSLFAVPNRDARAFMAGLTLAAQRGDELYERCGRWPSPIHGAARLQWLQSEAPDRFARAAHVLSISDWINHRLCGVACSEPTQAGETLLLDVRTSKWADDLIASLDLPRGIFPELRRAGERIGQLTSESARALGLTAGVPVGLGGGDTQCGLLGAGVLEVGEVGLVAGTTAPIQQVVGEPNIDGQRRLWTTHHLIADRWLLESNAGPLGEAVDWIARLLYAGSRAPVARLFAEASTTGPGARGLMSSLGAEVMDAKSMGLPIGQLTLSHLSTAHEPSARPHLARAVVEGLACAVRANLEQLAEVAGTSLAPVHMTGGLSRSEVFASEIAGVLGAPVHATAYAGATALGAALCAATAVGAHPDLQSAARAHVRLRAPAAPDPSLANERAALYQRWSIYRAARAEADRTASELTMAFAMAGGGAAAPTPERPGPSMLVTADLDASALRALQTLGPVEDQSFRRTHRMLAGATMVEAMQGHQILITEIDLLDAVSIEALPQLRIVGVCRGDPVNVDVDACTAFGIPVVHTPGRNADAVADLTLTFMLMGARRFPQAAEFLRRPGIEPGDLASLGEAFATLQGRELWNKTIGLVGFGAIGRKVAERLQGFGARLLVADPYLRPEQAALADAELVAFDALLAQSDFVSLHAAVTPETEGLMDKRHLALMRPGAWLINTARAALLDEAALIEALESGALGGAALDTFSVEPPGSDLPLVWLDNVSSTPHVGGNTSDVAAHQGELIAHQIACLLSGERPAHLVNPEVLDGFDLQAARPAPTAARLDALKAATRPVVSDLQKTR